MLFLYIWIALGVISSIVGYFNIRSHWEKSPFCLTDLLLFVVILILGPTLLFLQRPR